MSELLRSTKPTARKRHQCAACLEHIEPGEQYVRSSYTEDGHAYDWKEHRDCHTVIQQLFDDGCFDDDGCPEGALVQCFDPDELPSWWSEWFERRFRPCSK